MEKNDFLKEEINHIDITSFDSNLIINAYREMSFSARETARAADIYVKMLEDPNCTIFLSLAGSTSAGGCMKVYSDMVKHNMVDAVIATGASIVDMDFFEALGFKHYKGNPCLNDGELRDKRIDRIYDTLINEDQLQHCDLTTKEIADSLEPGHFYSAREFIKEMGRYLVSNSVKKNSLIQTAYEKNVPIFCAAFSDSSAGFGLVKHQESRIAEGKDYIDVGCGKEFRELTKIKLNSKESGLFMIGGGVPKNFIQDTVVCAEVAYGKDVPMHKYAIQITVADVRDGACSSSTLKEASSWGKVDAQSGLEQMVYAEATLPLPLIVSYAYHKGNWVKSRPRREFSKIFD